jgi:hypothetical protein
LGVLHQLDGSGAKLPRAEELWNELGASFVQFLAKVTSEPAYQTPTWARRELRS